MAEPKYVELDFRQMNVRVWEHGTVSFAIKDGSFGRHGSLTDKEALELANTILTTYQKEDKTCLIQNTKSSTLVK